MAVTNFEQRRKDVLHAIVEAYIQTAQPVGSELIAKRLRESVSSATIRHIMVELEEQGFVEQPHTSAGRVPTERGYRAYVDSLPQGLRRRLVLPRAFEDVLPASGAEIEPVLARVSEVLAAHAQQVAFVLVPTVKQSRVRQIELVPLSVRKLLCVLVANDDVYTSHIVEIQEPITRDEAVALARFVNAELAGLLFSEVLESLERRLLAERDSLYHMVKRSLGILQHALAGEPSTRLLLEGASYVVTQPEFSRDPQRAHALLRGLEAQEALAGRLAQDLATGRMQVRIGEELQVPGLDRCSTVAAPFIVESQVLGSIGVLGPTRMDYARLTVMVEELAQALTEAFAGERG